MLTLAVLKKKKTTKWGGYLGELYITKSTLVSVGV
jgi:hypothetical protein